MDERDRQGLPLMGLLVLALIGGIVVFQKHGYEGSRPQTEGHVERPLTRLENVRARLWQDPFTAVQNEIQREKLKQIGRKLVFNIQPAGRSPLQPESQGLGDPVPNDDSASRTDPKAISSPIAATETWELLASQIQMPSAADTVCGNGTKALKEKLQGPEKPPSPMRPTPKPVLVLGVMVDGAPYGETTENRIRMRYAILSALARLGYQPEAADRLGCFLLTDENSNESIVVPFELVEENKQISDRDQQYERAVLLWLDENRFSGKPYQQIGKTFSIFTDIPGFTLQSVVIGPWSSDTYRIFRNDGLPILLEQKDLQIVEDLKIVSATVTSPERSGQESDKHELHRILEILKDRKKQFPLFPDLNRFLPYDNVVAEKAVEELKRRGVDLEGNRSFSCFGLPARVSAIRKNTFSSGWDQFQGCDPHLILISDWDTHYGRAWENLLRAELGEYEYRLHSFYYERGLDGSVPVPRNVAGAKPRESPPTIIDNDFQIAEIERPDGRSQFDYLRRLADRIASLDRQFQQASKGRVRAVAVVGSDVYDKLLVLQALRERFPSILFFTADMDARYLHPRQLAWTRNLIVISPFGLSLSQKLQGEIPPFRDSYQTAVFLTTLSVVAGEGDYIKLPSVFDEDAEYRNHLGKYARIFEIGNDRAYDLSPNEPDSGLCRNKLDQDVNECTTLHPKPHNPLFPNITLAWLFVALAIGSFYLYYSVRSFRHFLSAIAAYLWIDDRALKRITEISPDTWIMVRWFFTFIFALVLVLLGFAAMRIESPRFDFQDLSSWPTSELTAILVFLAGFVSLLGSAWGTLTLRLTTSATADGTRSSTFFLKSGRFLARRTFWLFGLFPLFLGLFALFLFIQPGLAEGEPFSLLGGVSIWPSQVMRLLGVAIGLYLGLSAWLALARNELELSNKYFGYGNGDSNTGFRLTTGPDPRDPTRTVRFIERDIGDSAKIKTRFIDEKDWRDAQAIDPGIEDGPTNVSGHGEALWFNYRRLRRPTHREPLLPWLTRLLRNKLPRFEKYSIIPRDLRVAIVAGGFLVLGLVLVYGVDTLDVPYRGHWSFWVDKITGILMAGPIFFVLLFWVIHEIELCIGWIRRLSREDVVWPSKTINLAPKVGARNKKHADYARDWLALSMIADRTEAVGRILYIPFIVEFVMLFGQGPFFDNWDFSAGIAAITAISAIYALLAAIRMRRAAQEARARILERLYERRIAEKNADSRERASILAERMATLDLGAFRSWTRQPLVQALLWILSGIGLLAIEFSAMAE